MKSKVGAADLKPENLRYIGSYTWADTPFDKPTIIVPGMRFRVSILDASHILTNARLGSPREWTGAPVPFVVQRDVQIQFLSKGNYRMPIAPLLPVLVAVQNVTPDFDWSSVDIVTNRNGLRKLLRWIDGSVTRDFRIDLQLAGSRTVLMNRWEFGDRESHPFPRYGINFEKRCTRAAANCEDGMGHHRVVCYVSAQTHSVPDKGEVLICNCEGL